MMKRRSMVVALMALMVAMATAPPVHGLPDDQSPGAVKKWLEHFPHAKPKLERFHFYLHNIVSKNPPDSIPVAQTATTASNPITSFGLVNVIYGPLTEKPDSEIIGYSQGMFTFASQGERATLMTLNFVFTAGKYSGSTLSVLRWNAVTRKYREFLIIGGSGDFRMAQGIGTISSYYVNATSGDDIIKVVFNSYIYTVAELFS